MPWLVLAGQLLPFVIQAIGLVESLFGPGTGPKKKQAVLDMSKTVVTAMQTVSTGGQKETWDNIAEPVGKMVDAAVAIANAWGVFDKMSSGGSTANDV